MDMSIIFTLVLIASVLAYLFLPARQRDIDGNPIVRSPVKPSPAQSFAEPVISPYRRSKPGSTAPAEPATFRGKGSLLTAPMTLPEGLYQLTCQSAAEQTITVHLKSTDGAMSRSLAQTSGLSKHRFSLDDAGVYRLEVECETQVTWALLVKPL